MERAVASASSQSPSGDLAQRRGGRPQPRLERRAPDLAVDDERDVGAALEDVARLREPALAVERVAEDPRADDHARGRAGLLGAVDALPGERHGRVEVALGRADDRLGDQRVELGDQVALLGDLGRVRRGRVRLLELAERSRSRSRAPPRAKAAPIESWLRLRAAAAASSSAATPSRTGPLKTWLRPDQGQRHRARSTGRRVASPISVDPIERALDGRLGRATRRSAAAQRDQHVDPGEELEVAERLGLGDDPLERVERLVRRTGSCSPACGPAELDLDPAPPAPRVVSAVAPARRRPPLRR